MTKHRALFIIYMPRCKIVIAMLLSYGCITVSDGFRIWGGGDPAPPWATDRRRHGIPDT